MHNKINRLSIVVLIILVSMSTFSTNLYIPALPMMVTFFHSHSAMIQQSLVSFTYGFALCMLFSGVLADSLGRKRTLIIGLTIYSVTTFFALFCHVVWELILLRFLQGLGGCCGTVVARVIVRDKFDDSKVVSVLALLSSGMAVAFILAPIIGSSLVHFFSWRACFVLMLFVGVLMTTLVFFLFEKEEEKGCAKKVNWKSIFSKYQLALRSRSFLIHTAAISISWTGFFLIIMEYPFIMMSQMHCSVLKFGVIFSVILLGYLVGARIASRLSVRGVSSDQAVFFGIVIMCFSGLIALIDFIYVNEWTLTLCAFIYLLGMGIQIPNSQFAAIPAEEKKSATITSLFYFIEMGVVAMLSDFFKAHFAISATPLWCALFFSMLVFLLVYVCVYILQKRRDAAYYSLRS